MEHLFILRDQDATQHLFRVSSGLDSLVLGEGQILAQVRAEALLRNCLLWIFLLWIHCRPVIWMRTNSCDLESDFSFT